MNSKLKRFRALKKKRKNDAFSVFSCKKRSRPTRFELAQGDPSGFQVHLLNHSDTVATLLLQAKTKYIIHPHASEAQRCGLIWFGSCKLQVLLQRTNPLKLRFRISSVQTTVGPASWIMLLLDHTVGPASWIISLLGS